MKNFMDSRIGSEELSGFDLLSSHLMWRFLTCLLVCGLVGAPTVNAIEFEVNSLSVSDLKSGSASGVNYRIDGREKSLSGQRRAKLDHPNEREISFVHDRHAFGERRIRLLSTLPDEIACPKARPVFLIAANTKFTKKGLDLAYHRIFKGTCGDLDSAVLWYEAAFDNLGEAMSQIEAEGKGALDSIYVVARYLTALENACRILSYESACETALGYLKIYASELQRNEVRLGIGADFSLKLHNGINETLYKNIFRHADQIKRKGELMRAASRFAELTFRCSENWSFCEHRSLTPKFIYSHFKSACSAIRPGDQDTEYSRVCGECLNTLDQISGADKQAKAESRILNQCKPF